jgi:hypothetical protein
MLREQGGTPYLEFMQQIMMEAWNQLIQCLINDSAERP